LRKTRERICKRVSPSFRTLYLEPSFINLGAQVATSMHQRGSGASEEEQLSIFSLGSQAFLTSGELLEALVV